MKNLLGISLIVVGVILGIYVSFWVMLYGGIMQAINNWDVDNSAVVWGIIRAVFFELGGLPGTLLAVIGYGIRRK